MIPPSFSLWQVAAGLALSLLIGYAGYRKQSLSAGGLLGAVVTGTLVFGLGGWGWGALLIAFFVSASALSQFRQAEKAEVAAEFAKGGRRDLGQALANGGLGSLLAVLYLPWPHPLWIASFVGAMAAVNADTWATEAGLLFGRRPRLITTGAPVPPGTSGGISLAGSLAAAGGALFIGALAGFFQWVQARGGVAGLPPAWSLVVAGLGGGVAGSFADSLLGATLQGVYYCPRCGKETESPVHRCGTPARPLRGWRWLDNDVVNFVSSAAGAAVAAALAWLLAGGI